MNVAGHNGSVTMMNIKYVRRCVDVWLGLMTAISCGYRYIILPAVAWIYL